MGEGKSVVGVFLGAEYWVSDGEHARAFGEEQQGRDVLKVGMWVVGPSQRQQLPCAAP